MVSRPVCILGVWVVCLLLVLTSRQGAGHSMGSRDRMRLMPDVKVKAPRRPSSFATVDELEKYMEELRQYYSLLGRPRYGRSVLSSEERAEGHS